MSNNLLRCITSVSTAVVILVPVIMAISSPVNAELGSLFSTPEERKIIDANRYKSAVEVQVIEDDGSEGEMVELIQEEVTVSYQVSGITLSNSGPHFAWINNEVYEDGQLLEDDSQIKVMSGSKIQIKITAPDGKIYYANSGETIDVTYLVTVNNQ